MSIAERAEPIEIPFGGQTGMGPRNCVLDGGAHWRHLANTMELSVCGSDDAALCQITFTTCDLQCLDTVGWASGL